ncbi:MAG: insulinase family protein [Endomicrobium sp.]|nr:insulinase family protein [Endomicrobium sp.]
MKYKNGLTSVLINDKNSLTASIVVFVRVGAVDEKSSQAGLSHFIEHLIFKGSKKYPKGTLDKSVERMGGYINAFTCEEFTLYRVDIQKDGIEESVKILADSIKNPLFMQSEIDMEKNVVIEEIQRHYDNPISILYEKFNKVIYKESAMRNSIIGTRRVITNISKEEICDYHKTHYISDKMIVVITGDFDKQKVKIVVDEFFGSFEKQIIPPDPLFVEKIHSGIDIIDFGKVELGYMFMGFLGPDISSEDIFAAELTANILGGGKSSKLYRVLYEEKHIVHSICSYFVTGKGTGCVFVYTIFKPENLNEIKNEIKKQIENIIAGNIKQEDLNRAKLAIITNWKFSFEISYDISYKYGYYYLMNRSEIIKEYVNKIENSTIEDVVKFLTKYYCATTLSSVVLLPEINKRKY